MTTSHRVGYVGNFRKPWCSEVHWKASLESLGHSVVAYQEDVVDWTQLAAMAADDGVDFVMWTRTWHLPSKNGTSWETQLGALAELERRGIPTVGYHLDRWWGLDREHQVHDEPFFRQTLVCTADGGHDEQWAAAGVSHRWFTPGVWGAEARVPGRPRAEWARDVGFVGSWERYHHEWAYRMELVHWLHNQYQRHGQLIMLPQGGQPVRGFDLNDLYASVRVVVGDSCLAGQATRYWSDRIPETLGRGGFLIHPRVDGLEDHYTDGEHLVLYDLGDWTTLRQLIHVYAREHEERARIARAGQAHVLEHHTYEVRMAELIEMLHSEGIVGEPDTAAGRRRVYGAGGLSGLFDMRTDTSDALVVNEVWRLNTYELPPDVVAGRTVVDVGANVGAFTVWALVAGAASVMAYEPEPGNYQQLVTNVGLNGFEEQVVASPCAVLGFNTNVELYWGKDSASTEVRVARKRATSIRAIAISDVLKTARGLGRPIVVKLDCEGSEFSIFAGWSEADWEEVETLVMEFHPPIAALVPAGDSGFGSMVEQMAEHGRVRMVGRPSVGGLLWVTAY